MDAYLRALLEVEPESSRFVSLANLGTEGRPLLDMVIPHSKRAFSYQADRSTSNVV